MFVTARGNVVNFQHEVGIEYERESLWTLDKVTAFVNGKEAGYLRVSYIRGSTVSEKMGDGILSYVGKVRGHCIYPFEQRSKNFSDLSRSDKESFLCAAYWHLKQVDFSMRREELMLWDNNKIAESLNELKEAATRIHGYDFEQFLKFHVDKPVVDYIKTNTGFRGLGIGHALYLEGARWIAGKGMRLYASGLQSDSAKESWARLSSDGLVVIEGNRKYLLDFSQKDIAKAA